MYRQDAAQEERAGGALNLVGGPEGYCGRYGAVNFRLEIPHWTLQKPFEFVVCRGAH